jgi:hypothetical protein
MTRNHLLGVIVIAALVPALPVLPQAGAGGGIGRGAAPRNRQPITVEFKTTRVQTLANGTTITTETKEGIARDQEMRHMTATTGAQFGDRPAITNVHVSDPTTGDEINWSSVNKVAHDVRRPVGADRHGCWASADGRYRTSFGGGMAPGPLQPPAGAATTSPSLPSSGSLMGSSLVPQPADAPSGKAASVISNLPSASVPAVMPRRSANNIVTEDLGADNIMGVEVRGSRTTITTPIGAEGNDQPLVRIDETWMAPSLGMVLRSITDDPRIGKMDREVVSLDLNAPDPALFQPPADYKVEIEVLQPVPCGQ